MSKLAKTTLGVDKLEVVADRGYFNSPEILACHEADIFVTLPKAQTTTTGRRGASSKPNSAI